MNVAFPFASIKTMDADLADSVRELAEIVAALATEVDAQHTSAATAELESRAHAVADGLGAG